jgi:regulatory protein
MTSGAPDRPAAKLLQRAVALLAQREHSREELARKLLRRLPEGRDRADVNAVLDELQRRDLLSETRYAEAVVRTRSARYGDARLAQELTSRGVNAETARSALATLEGSEFRRARAVWARRFGALPASLEQRARQTRFLQSRGFNTDVIRRVLAGSPDEDPDA